MAQWRLHVVVAVLAACALPIGLLSTAAPARAAKRVALVIGNDRYPNLDADRQLVKAANDAQAVGDALAKIGFRVIRGSNLGRQGMIDKLAELTSQLEPGDTAAFFYAGHGVAIGGVNYVVPSDVPAVTPDAEARVRGASLSEPDLVAELEAKGVRVALLVLDACRDNPFPRSGTRSIGNTRGLVDAKPARGIFTIYSAGIGQTALDRLEPGDPDRNSVFTRVFVQELGRADLDLGGLAIEVREKVAELALTAKDDHGQPEPHEQTPAYYDQTIGGRIYLARLPAATAPPAPLTIPSAAASGRAVLYEEDPNDPQGERHLGSAVWRTETVSPGPGLAPERVVRADVTIPEKRMTVVWSLRRNTDKSLPASHLIEIVLSLPKDFRGGGIANVPGVLMKEAEQARGTPLAGLAVKVTTGYFLIGLSEVEAEEQHNVDLLRTKDWIDIPLVYNNGTRAILAIQKGALGDRVFSEVLTK